MLPKHRLITHHSSLIARLALACCIVAAVFAPAWAEEQKAFEAAGGKVTADVLESNLPDAPTFRASGRVHIEYQGKTLDAENAQGDLQTGDVTAAGDLTFTSEFGTMTAKSLHYNFRSGHGFLESAIARGDGVIFRGEHLEAGPAGYVVCEAIATGCDLPHPHYRIGAREIIVKPGVSARARRASLWIGDMKIISVPSIRINLGPKKTTEIPLPKPGFDSRDGFFFSIGDDLISGRRTYFRFEIRPTIKRGLQGAADYEYLLDGSPPGRALRPQVIQVERELRSLMLGVPGTREAKSLPGEQGYELRGFASVQVKERAYGYRVTDLRVTRWPEVGVKWVSGSLEWRPAPMQAVSGEAKLSYGRFREYPGDKAHERWDLRGLGAARIARIGGPTTVRVVGMVHGSSYSTDETFRVLGGGIDIAHALSNDTGAALRFITHSYSGSTPFEFDNVDIRNEAGLVLRRVTDSGTQQLELRYDLQRNRLYDWEFSVSRVFHCLEPSITWRNKFSQLTLGLRLVGLQGRSY